MAKSSDEDKQEAIRIYKEQGEKALQEFIKSLPKERRRALLEEVFQDLFEVIYVPFSNN